MSTLKYHHFFHIKLVFVDFHLDILRISPIKTSVLSRTATNLDLHYEKQQHKINMNL